MSGGFLGTVTLRQNAELLPESEDAELAHAFQLLDRELVPGRHGPVRRRVAVAERRTARAFDRDVGARRPIDEILGCAHRITLLSMSKSRQSRSEERRVGKECRARCSTRREHANGL